MAGGAVGIPRLSTALSQNSCSKQTVKAGIVTAEGCFTKDGTTYTATDEVDVNGFTLTPTEDAPLKIDTSSRHVTTAGKKIGFAARPLGFDPTAFNFNAPTSGEMPLTEIDSDAISGPDLGGLSPVQANIPVSLVEGGGRIDPTVDMTQVFKLIRKDFSTTIRIDVLPGKGAQFDGIKFSFQGPKLGPFIIRTAEGEFSEHDRTWGGFVDLLLTPEAGGVEFGFQIKDGELDELTIGLDNLNISIVEGIFLQEIVGSLKFDKLEIAADLKVRVTGGPQIDIFGTEVAAVTVDGDLGFDTGSSNHPGFLELGGDVKVVRIEVADVDFKVFFNGAVDFGARVGIGLPDFNTNPHQAFFIGGGLNGWIHGKRYNIDGDVEARVIGITIAKGEGVVSDRGAATCGTFFKKPSGGGGFSWQVRKVVVFAPLFCYIGRYSDPNQAGARIASTGSSPIRLDGRHSFLRIVGDGGVPAFRLEAPDGRVIEHPASSESVRVPDSHLVLSNHEQNTAHLEVLRPKGRWHITELEGPRIVRVEVAPRLAEPRVEAEVRGKGARRTLVWNARDFPKQRLQFAERLPGGTMHPILLTAKASGKHRFRPLQGGHYGKRRLMVGVQQRFSQRARLRLGTYRVPRPRRPGKVRRVRAVRRGHDTIVRWRKAKRARSYRVELIGPGKAFRLTRTVGQRRSRVIFRHSPSGGRMLVRVWALNRDGRPGRAGGKRLRTEALVRGLAGTSGSPSP